MRPRASPDRSGKSVFPKNAFGKHGTQTSCKRPLGRCYDDRPIARPHSGAREIHLTSPESSTVLAGLYRTMVRIRAFENAAEIASQGGVSAYGQSAAGTARVNSGAPSMTAAVTTPINALCHCQVSGEMSVRHKD